MNLAKRVTPNRSKPQHTFRRETTMPRQATDLPQRVSSGRIHRPDMSDAEQLSRILGLASEVGQNIAGDIQEGKDKRDSAEAMLDFASDNKDDARFAKSRAYRDAWQREAVKSLSVDIGTQVSEAVNDRLNDSDNPATPEEIDALVETIFSQHILDEEGNLKEFGTVEAKTILANALSEVKKTVMPQAITAIGKQVDEQFLNTSSANALLEHFRGAAIGAAVEVDIDPDFVPVPEGWSGNEADAIEELGMTQAQAKEFLKTGKDPRVSDEPQRPAPKAKPDRVSLGRPTGRPPHPGAVTSTFSNHAKRGSAGVDIDGRLGDPIQAPAGGRVVSVDADPRSGLFVRVDHGNGIVSSYSHLQLAKVREGQVVRPGQTIATMGNSGNTSKRTGDGSHLHWRVKVNDKDVDPLSFSFRNAAAEAEGTVASIGNEPQLATELPSRSTSTRPAFDIEGWLASLPPSINKGQAKAHIIQALKNKAFQDDDPSWLGGLEESTRPDGTPSFNPKETAEIISARDQLAERSRRNADRAEKELFETNQTTIIEAILSDEPPSDEFISAAALNNQIDDGWAWSILRQRESERRREESELRAEEREADRRREAEVYEFVNGEVALRESGIVRGQAADKRLLDSGRLGEGNFALARYNRLRAADRNAQRVLESNPEVAAYAAQLDALKAPKQSGGSFLETRGRAGGTKMSDTDHAAMVVAYKNYIKEGVDPAAAYLKAVKEFGPKDHDAEGDVLRRRIQEMARRRTLAGR